MERSIGRREPFVGSYRAPSSKPETQRALVMAALADGVSVIRDPLLAHETRVMIEGCRAIGAHVDVSSDLLRVGGVPSHGLATGRPGMRYVWAAGSALVGRLFSVIGSALPDRVIIDGNSNLRSRPFAPLFAALRAKGLGFDFFDGVDRLPCAALSTELPGGMFVLETSVSSQFATAVLVPAPLAAHRTVVRLEGPLYSLSYIEQTIAMMRRFGVPVRVDATGREIVVPAGQVYHPQSIQLTGDYTAASYLLAAAFTTRGRITVANLDPTSLQGERAILAILENMGASLRWTDEAHTVELDCTRLPNEVDARVDLTNAPNILPTVAAMAATIPGRTRIRGARLTQNHKSPRIEAIATELAKLGVPCEILRDRDEAIDGLEVRGRGRLIGDADFASHGDHRIFMSLVTAAMACERPCRFGDGVDAGDSFPGFAEIFGLQQMEVERLDERELVASAG